jgi:transposase-like protein
MIMNIIEIINRFPDQSACISYLEELRWQNKPECPCCKSKHSSKRHETHRHLCNGLSARQLSRDLGVNRKTGWYLQMRIRRAMQDGEDSSLFKGIVEVDETYVGGKKANHSKKKRQARRDNNQQITGMQDKQPVIGLLERDGRIKLQVVNQAHGKTIKPIIEQTVSKDATLVTDGFGGYAGLSKIFREHQILNKDQQEYARGKYHTNTIEGFWTLLKRGIYGQYHKVSTRHLQSYLDEFTFKYNHRANRFIFELLINKITAAS